MKALKNILGLFIIIALVSCKNEATPEVVEVDQSTEVKADLDPNASYTKVTFNVKGMTCEIGCAKTIEKKLANMEGVKSAKVNFEAELAMVEFDEAKVNEILLEETVENVSDTYTVQDIRVVNNFEDKE